MKSFDRIILVDKPAGISSFGVVAQVRRVLTDEKLAGMRKIDPEVTRKMARVKVGHSGTLDPFATGLLILLSGKFTRRAGEFLKLDKVYEATIRLGATSTTGDPEGEITEKKVQTVPSLTTIKKLLQEKFTGKITQTPPIYSAIKIDGERAYKLARKGEAPKMPEREVEIYDLEILQYDFPLLAIRAHVSSGTYIRTLAEDIGAALGTGAYALALRRVRIGEYDVSEALTIDSID
jgi:tRNA pseudouridine55 synthase